MRLAILLALVCTGCATTYSPPAGVATTTVQPSGSMAAEAVTIPTELTDIHPAIITAWQSRDPNAFEVYFTPTTTLVTPTGTFTGWTDIGGKFFTPLLPNISSYTLTPSKFTRQGSNMILETGNYTYTLNSNGAASNVSGTYSYNWMKQPDGTWKLMSVTIK